MVDSLFSYRKGSSFIHLCSPLLKLSVMILFSVILFSNVFFTAALFIWIKIGLLFGGAVFFAFSAGIPLSRIKALRFVLFLGFFVTAFKVIQLEIVEGSLAFGFDVVQSYDGLLYTARFFTASLYALIFFETTSPLETQEALESIQRSAGKIFPPLKRISFSLHVSLAISFIPEIFSVWYKIRLASRARRNKKKRNIIKAIEIFSIEFTALLSIMITKAVKKRKALMSRMQYGR